MPSRRPRRPLCPHRKAAQLPPKARCPRLRCTGARGLSHPPLVPHPPPTHLPSRRDCRACEQLIHRRPHQEVEQLPRLQVVQAWSEQQVQAKARRWCNAVAGKVRQGMECSHCSDDGRRACAPPPRCPPCWLTSCAASKPMQGAWVPPHNKRRCGRLGLQGGLKPCMPP